jgi:hypothetical protein
VIEIIPAIDLIDGKCVRLSQGDYNQKKVYNENPLEVARILPMPVSGDSIPLILMELKHIIL